MNTLRSIAFLRERKRQKEYSNTHTLELACDEESIEFLLNVIALYQLYRYIEYYMQSAAAITILPLAVEVTVAVREDQV